VPENLLRDCIPGVLSDRQVSRLIRKGLVLGVADEEGQIDYSSFDLTVDNIGYRMISGAIKPFGHQQAGSYEYHILRDPQYAEKMAVRVGIYDLEPKQTYVFKLQQKLDAARLRQYKIFGQATAKSSIGRVDVLARLIVDGMNSYEEFTPDGIGNANGDMFLEVTPMTFHVRIKVGFALNQLRLFYGHPTHSEIRGPELYRTVLIQEEDEGKTPDECLSLDLESVKIGGLQASAFCARSSSKSIDLWKENDANPLDFWTIETAKVRTPSNIRMLEIKERAFYILRSREKIRLPKNVAVYCRAIDETIGEMRIHYAGFVHPFFGERRPDRQIGTPLIFEVRGHDVNVALTQGERMARLTFYRMSEDCRYRKPTTAKKKKKTKYNQQELQLSAFFKQWPSVLRKQKAGALTKA
jgi:dCTP deaminase